MDEQATAFPLPGAVAVGERAGRLSAPAEEVTGLFEQFRTPLFRYLLSMGLAAADAEETIQETFLSLFDHLRQDKPRDNLRGWIFRVAHNRALKLRMRGVEESEAEAAALVDPGPTPEDRAAHEQRRRRLTAVVEAMSERERACLALRAEGLRYREIAGVLGVSLGSVANALERALAKLARADGV